MAVRNRRKRMALALGGFALAFILVPPRPAGGIEPTDIPRSDLFPLFPSLRDNVEFWIRVYGEWHNDCLIVHDSEHPLVIYEIVDLRQLLGTDKVPDRVRREYVTRLRNRYAERLTQLARSDPRNLSEEERRLLALWEPWGGWQAIPAAAENVRVQRGNRDFFLYGLRQSGRYIDRMREIFRSYGLPEELTALPHVESCFNWSAYSHMGAAGIWQFTRSTGRLFLRIGYEVDERLDPFRSTEAAAQLLRKNYEELGTWPLAITAYNHGLAGMRRAVELLGTRDFEIILKEYRSRSFRFASKNFYAEFLAALYVRTHHTKFFGSVEPEPPLTFLEFQLQESVPARTIAEVFELSLEELRQLNPSLRAPVWRGQRRIPRGFTLRLPVNLKADPGALLAQALQRAPRAQTPATPANGYLVQRGETLSDVARKTGVSVPDLLASNDHIADPDRIRAGQVLRLPTGERSNARQVQNAAPTPSSEPASVSRESRTPLTVPPADKGVAQGGSLDELHWVPYDTSASWNVVTPRTRLIDRVEVPTDGWIRVQPEETLGHYAEWLKVTAQELRRLNNLPSSRELRIGQRIRLTFRNVSPEEFHRQRVEYLRSIEEDFFATYRVTGLRTHRVGPGENIWSICHSDYDLPLWLIWMYNTDVDLSQLQAGQELRIPIVEPIDASKPEPQSSP
ncbi:MAG: LysM peptidoglycan-binding domain-containing protein [candidate division KSB1 bacterium]|nr:LysM peptidoglycan-binding domain-containing protein [candidate division KSB1 bacterium]